MKKSVKLSLTIIITIAAYALFYYLVVSGFLSSTEVDFMSMFYISVISGIVAIPIGIGITWLLQKKNVVETKSQLIILVIGLIYAYFFGWLSLLGMEIGHLIMKKDGNTKSSKTKSK